MTTYADIFKDGLYQYMVGPSYDAYVQSSVETILRHARDAQTALSVGCGNGDIEAAIGDRLDLTLHDTHGAASTAHQDLHWLPHLPNGQFDYVYAHGSVFACVPQDQKQKFIDDLAARVRDGGTLYVCGGNTTRCRCRGRAYSVNGKTVTEAVTKYGADWHILTTHVWGVSKIDVTYYTAKVADYFAPHTDRIRCVTGATQNRVTAEVAEIKARFPYPAA